MSGVFFNGQLLVSPVTASVINDDAMRNQNLSVGNVVAIIGTAYGGEPKTALSFGSPEEAKRTLVGGELLDGVLAAFAPSTETNGPSRVLAVRVNPATQATGALKNGSAATVIDLLSRGYGLRENDIRVSLAAGSVSGIRATVERGDTYYTKDGLERKAFSVHYTGSEATATVTVTGTTVVLHAPAGTVAATVDLTVYSTVQQAVDRINQVAGFTAATIDSNYTKPALNGLDFVSAVNCKTSAVTIKGDLQAVIDWLNSAQQDLVTATRATGAGTPPATGGAAVYLSGGSDGVTTTTDWSDAFAVMQSVDAQWICPASGDGAIRAMADAHCIYMSNVARKERRAITGMDLGSTDNSALLAAKALNSDRTSLVHIGHYNYGIDGKLTLFPPYITAAMIAGAFSGVSPGTPLTNKTIRVQGLERLLRNPTDTDVLINGGVMCVESTDRGYKVVKSISTWLVNENYNRVEQSSGVALDFTARNVREALDVLRGQKANPLLLSRAYSITESTLRELARNEPQGPGVLAGDEQTPAYRNIKASVQGDVLRVQYECSPVIPANYVLVTIFAVPFSGTIG